MEDTCYCGLWMVAVVAGIAGGIKATRYLTTRRRQTPGPKGYPFIGILMKLGDFSSLHKKLTSYGKIYGKIFQFKVLGKRQVVLRSASIIDRALTDVNLTDRKEPFFQKYIFNGKSFAFSDYGEHVPELRNVFFLSVYSKWHSDKGLVFLLGEAVTRFGNARIKGNNSKSIGDIDPDSWIKDTLTDVYSYLINLRKDALYVINKQGPVISNFVRQFLTYAQILNSLFTNYILYCNISLETF